MEKLLPDEIIEAILWPVLYVSDDCFSSIASTSPFSGYRLTTSTVLLVAKNWLRVATPLLYETVILRSKAQTHAFATALKGNKPLGQFVKRMRIEGGYGLPMLDILKRTLNVEDLWVTANLTRADRIGGYLRGFAWINPQRLILHDTGSEGPPVRKAMYHAVSEAIKKHWNKLDTVQFPPAAIEDHHLLPLTLALRTCSIRYLCIVGSLSAPTVVPPCVIKLCKLPTLKEILIKIDARYPRYSNPSALLGSPCDLLKQNKDLSNKVTYSTRHPAFSRGYIPKANILSVTVTNNDTKARPLPLSCLSSILRYASGLATTTQTIGLPLPLEPGTAWHINRMARQQFRSQTSLVSKGFHTLMIPLLYEVPVVTSELAMQSLALSPHKRFIKILCLDMNLSSHNTVRIFEVLLRGCVNLKTVSHFRSTYADESDEFANYKPSDIHDSVPLTTTSFDALSKSSGTTLQHLHLPLVLDGPNQFPKIVHNLGLLMNLRSLVFSSRTSMLASHLPVPSVSLSRDALSRLEHLAVYTEELGLSSAFLKALAELELPSLHHCDFPDPGVPENTVNFLRVHGRKLTRIQIKCGIATLFSKLCPKVVLWVVAKPVDVNDFNFTCLSAVTIDDNVALAHILILGQDFGPNECQKLADTDLSSLKFLRDVYLQTRLAWPRDQQSIESSVWVPVLEELYEMWGVRFHDSTGEFWRPRLKLLS